MDDAKRWQRASRQGGKVGSAAQKFAVDVQNRVLGVEGCNGGVGPDGRPDAVNWVIVHIREENRPVILPLLVDVIYASLKRNSRRKQDDPRQRGQTADESFSPGHGQVFGHLQRDGQIERTVDRQWFTKVMDRKGLGGNQKTVAINVRPVDPLNVRHTEFTKCGQPGPHAAPDVHHGGRGQPLLEEGRYPTSRIEGRWRLAFVEAARVPIGELDHLPLGHPAPYPTAMRRGSTSLPTSAGGGVTIQDPAVRAYYRHLDEVPGWFAALDFITLVALDRYQHSSGISGDILEIGAYVGKSAILLGLLVRGAEQLVVCDIFDGSVAPTHDHIENRKWYGAGVARTEFESWYRTFHHDLPVIVERPSSDLEATVAERTFRLIHVDGSHVYETVRTDLAFAHHHLGPGGIVVLDDFGRPHAPGVGAATWEAVFNSGLRPFLLTEGKLYASWENLPGLVEYLLQWAAHVGLQVQTYSIPNGELLLLQRPSADPSWLKRLTSLLVPPVIPAITRRARRTLTRRRAVGPPSSGGEWQPRR